MFTREFVEKAYNTTENDLIWKPIYPNNMPDNGVEGYYCLMLHKDKDGKYSGRKYSIIFQYEEVEKGSGLINTDKINAFILFEKVYREIIGPLDYPSSIHEESNPLHSKNTLNSYDMNSFGSFVYAYDNIDDAKKRALSQYKAIYGYVASYMIEDD